MLTVEHLKKSYGTVEAIRDVSFTVTDGELVCIVGPSGCGKTTLLKCIARLLPADAGKVTLDGTLALVFQEYGRSLFPWMTVRQNVAFPLRRKKLDKREVRATVEQTLASVGLEHTLDRYPWQLSGGMQQRVAIARALAFKPQLLLMDEPFASVDAQTRADLEDLVLELRRQYDVTIVFVTHDIDESVYLSDRIVVLTPSPTSVQEVLDVPLGQPRADLEDLVLELRRQYDVTIVFVTHDIDESVYLSDRIVMLTPSPTSVQEVLDVPLGQPRDQVQTKERPEFAQLRAHVWRSIKRPENENTPVGV